MSTIPNLGAVENMAAEINSEYDLGPKLDRYSSLSPELLDLASDHGLEGIDAARALFVSDYIVTTSEVPPGVSDEDRRISIIKAFVSGKGRNEDTDRLMRVFYLAQKVKQGFRRTDYFLAGRGLGREQTLVILKDIFITPYLEVCRQMLGDGDQLWESAVLYSAIKHTLPDKELLEVKDGLAYMWEQLVEYSKILVVEQNDTLTIPNITDTQAILLMGGEDVPCISISNIQRGATKEEVDSIRGFLDYLDSTDRDRSLVYVNSTIVGTDENIILVRNPGAEGKPVLFIRTKADELNVSQVMSILDLRGCEDWSHLGGGRREVTWIETVEEEEEVEVEKEVIEIVEKKVTETVNKEVVEIVEKEVTEKVTEEVEVTKRGLLGRLLGREPKKVKKTVVRKVKKKVPVEVRKTVPTKVTKMVPTEVKKRVKTKEKRVKTHEEQRSAVIAENIPSFVADAVTALALGDLDLFEIWDTVRDSEYVVVGAVESDFNDDKTILHIVDDVGSPEDLAATLDGLDEVVEAMIKSFFGLDVDILPNDILFVRSDGEHDNNYYISFDGNEDRLMGTIAVTYQKKSIGFAKEDGEDDVVNRRTMKMRTRQLLSSREHTPFDTSVERILGDTISEKAETIELEKAILTLH